MPNILDCKNNEIIKSPVGPVSLFTAKKLFQPLGEAGAQLYGPFVGVVQARFFGSPSEIVILTAGKVCAKFHTLFWQ